MWHMGMKISELMNNNESMTLDIISNKKAIVDAIKQFET